MNFKLKSLRRKKGKRRNLKPLAGKRQRKPKTFQNFHLFCGLNCVKNQNKGPFLFVTIFCDCPASQLCRQVDRVQCAMASPFLPNLMLDVHAYYMMSSNRKRTTNPISELNETYFESQEQNLIKIIQILSSNRCLRKKYALK